MIQSTVWSVSIVLMAALVVLFVWVAWGAETAEANYGPILAAWFRWRRVVAVALLAGFVFVNFESLSHLPYIGMARARATSAAPAQSVQAAGEEWEWTLKPEQVVAGQPVEFHVTSKDVNHGFGLYDPALNLIAQTQAMPGYENVLRVTLDKPGTYQILCLEYCGVMHHNMKTTLTVVAQ